jgi:hypothetical protein
MVGAAVEATTGATVQGAQLSASMAAQATNRLDRVYIGDAPAILADR